MEFQGFRPNKRPSVRKSTIVTDMNPITEQSQSQSLLTHSDDEYTRPSKRQSTRRRSSVVSDNMRPIDIIEVQRRPRPKKFLALPRISYRSRKPNKSDYHRKYGKQFNRSYRRTGRSTRYGRSIRDNEGLSPVIPGPPNRKKVPGILWGEREVPMSHESYIREHGREYIYPIGNHNYGRKPDEYMIEYTNVQQNDDPIDPVSHGIIALTKITFWTFVLSTLNNSYVAMEINNKYNGVDFLHPSIGGLSFIFKIDSDLYTRWFTSLASMYTAYMFGSHIYDYFTKERTNVHGNNDIVSRMFKYNDDQTGNSIIYKRLVPKILHSFNEMDEDILELLTKDPKKVDQMLIEEMHADGIPFSQRDCDELHASIDKFVASHKTELNNIVNKEFVNPSIKEIIRDAKETEGIRLTKAEAKEVFVNRLFNPQSSDVEIR